MTFCPVWPWKTIGHLFYATSSFVHHFVAISNLKQKFQSGNAQCRSKLTKCCPVWRWILTDDLKNNRAPLLCYFKDYAAFHSYLWIQTGCKCPGGRGIIVISFNVRVWYFEWNFKGYIWNSTQNIIPIHWKMWILFTCENLRALRFKSSQMFLQHPPGSKYITPLVGM